MNAATLPIRSVGGVVRTGMIAAALATIGNVIIYLVSSLFNVSFTVPLLPEPFTVTIVDVIAETLLMAAGATLVFALLYRLTVRAAWIFRVIAVVVLLVSLIFPLILPVEPLLKIVLSLMHIFSAIVIVRLFTRSQ